MNHTQLLDAIHADRLELTRRHHALFAAIECGDGDQTIMLASAAVQAERLACSYRDLQHFMLTEKCALMRAETEPKP